MIPDLDYFVGRAKELQYLEADEDKARLLINIWHEGWQQGGADTREIIINALSKEA